MSKLEITKDGNMILDGKEIKDNKMVGRIHERARKELNKKLPKEKRKYKNKKDNNKQWRDFFSTLKSQEEFQDLGKEEFMEVARLLYHEMKDKIEEEDDYIDE